MKMVNELNSRRSSDNVIRTEIADVSARVNLTIRAVTKPGARSSSTGFKCLGFLFLRLVNILFTLIWNNI